MTMPSPVPLTTFPRTAFTRDGVLRAETTTILPGGGLVTVTVRVRGDGYAVSDDGVARAALLALGIGSLTRGDAKRGNDIADRHGLDFDGQSFRLDDVSAEQLPAAISYLAEGCRAWVAGAVEARQRGREQGLVDRAVERLRSAFPRSQIDVEREFAGASSKLHRFDVAVALPGDRFALFETLMPVASSIAAAHMKFYDLKHAHVDWPREAVVENLPAWPSEDVAVMQQVASGIRGIEAAWDDIERLAA